MAKGLSQVDLARQIGRHQTTIGPYERDEYTPSLDILDRLAEALDSSPEYLLFGRSPTRPALPVTGRVTGGGVVVEAHEERSVKLLAEDRLELLLIEDDSMLPVFPAGAFAIVGRATKPIETLYGKTALAQLADGRILLRRLHPGTMAARCVLSAYNAPELSDVEVSNARPVYGFASFEAFVADRGNGKATPSGEDIPPLREQRV